MDMLCISPEMIHHDPPDGPPLEPWLYICEFGDDLHSFLKNYVDIKVPVSCEQVQVARNATA